MASITVQHEFAISCPDELWVASTVRAGGKWRLVLGIKEEQAIYPTREAAQLELDYMAPGEEGYEIEELDAESWGVQEPPQDYRIFNRRQPSGSFRPLAEYFDREEEAT